MKPTTRYTLTLEIEEDGKTTRKMIESRDKCDRDFADGEITAGILLSFVPLWIASDSCGTGLATVCSMLKFLPGDFADMQMFKDIGDAYVKWTGVHNWHECVSVVVDKSKLCSEG